MHNIKPDYCNNGGLEIFDVDDKEDSDEGSWCSWCSEDGEEDPFQYLEDLKQGK